MLADLHAFVVDKISDVGFAWFCGKLILVSQKLAYMKISELADLSEDKRVDSSRSPRIKTSALLLKDYLA
ncbi:hypothetical protein BpHYR1_010430 [Brachionus plicatilis]|uniref:Uncharacterized protein n=1 Tax=Brachionus plicatilis TaxID=10195 RepID=A0A3M7T966_BRAPC|nr:hypothetical protein BpHYR1_010430 [Brachionus plicatilis]